MDRNIVKGFIDPVILSVVARSDTYGYEIARYVNDVTEGALELKEGTLYPALRRLEVEKLIEGYWGNEDGGARRRYYRITKFGISSLESAKTEWKKNKRVLGLFLEEVSAL